MAQETERGCGYRVVGGLYLCGEYIPVSCDRLPYPLDVCPVCNHGIKPSRSYTKINPLRLFGDHLIPTIAQYHDLESSHLIPCGDNPHCFLCLPRAEPAFIITIGDRSYSPDSFLDEAARLGISKRIPFIPKELELGNTVVYLAHRQACRVATKEALPLKNGSNNMEADRIEYKYGIFSAFIPQRVEKLV